MSDGEWCIIIISGLVVIISLTFYILIRYFKKQLREI